MTGISYALTRAAAIYGALAALALVVGTVVSVVWDHELGLTLAVTFYITAGVLFIVTSLTQTRPRSVWEGMTDDERDELFSTQMWLHGVSASLAVTGGLIQVASSL